MVYVRLIDMPLPAHGFTRAGENGDYQIYINSKLSEEDRQKALMHELGHAVHNDGRKKECSGSEIEEKQTDACSIPDEVIDCGYCELK